LAFTKDFEPTDYSSKDAFFRGKLDVLLIDPQGNALILDHKTGYRNVTAYDVQLNTYAVLVAKAFAPVFKRDTGIEIKTFQSGLNFIESESLVWKDKISLFDMENTTLPWFVDWVSGIADGISEAKIKRGTHCKQCGFRSLCGSRVGKMKKKKKAVKSIVGNSLAL